MKRRVVVTGLGVVTSLGCQVEEFWTRVCNGESGVHPIQRFDATRFRSRFGGEIVDWSTDGYIDAQGRQAARPLRPVRPGRRRSTPCATPGSISPRKTRSAAA